MTCVCSQSRWQHAGSSERSATTSHTTHRVSSWQPVSAAEAAVASTARRRSCGRTPSQQISTSTSRRIVLDWQVIPCLDVARSLIWICCFFLRHNWRRSRSSSRSARLCICQSATHSWCEALLVRSEVAPTATHRLRRAAARRIGISSSVGTLKEAFGLAVAGQRIHRQLRHTTQYHAITGHKRPCRVN